MIRNMKENSRAKNVKFLYILKKECLSENDIRSYDQK